MSQPIHTPANPSTTTPPASSSAASAPSTAASHTAQNGHSTTQPNSSAGPPLATVLRSSLSTTPDFHLSQHFHHDAATLPVAARHNHTRLALTRVFNPEHIQQGQAMPYRTYLLSHVGNLLHFRDLSPIPPDSPARTAATAPPDAPTSPAPPTDSAAAGTTTAPPAATDSGGPTYHRAPLLTLAYNVLPLHHLPHPLTFSSPFFLALAAFSSSSLLLSNPFGPRGEKGREAVFSARGEMRRERVTAATWVPSAMVRRRGAEEREKERRSREERREKERRREAARREEKQRKGWTESEEERRRRHRKEEERRRRDIIAEEHYRREEEEEEERAAYLTTQQQQLASEGRMGWDTFLVGYADGSVLAFDRILDEEVAIADGSGGGSSGEYMRVTRQPVEGCNPTAQYEFGHPHAPPSTITSLTFSTAGSLLCVTQSNGVCCVVDWHRSALVACLSAYYGGWTCAAFTSDDALLLLGGEDDCLSVVETGRWEVVGRCEGHDGFVSAVYLRAMAEAGVYRIVSAGEDGRLLFWEWISGRRQRGAAASSVSSTAFPAKDNTHVYLRPYPPLTSLRTIQPLAANHVHYGPVSALAGSHSYTRRRREYRGVYAIEADVMELAADEEAAADCDECLVTAGWDWSIKVWSLGPGSAGAAGGGASAGGEVKRRRGKRLSMRVIQPSPQYTDRRLYSGDVSEQNEVSESGDGIGSRQLFLSGSPMSQSNVPSPEPERAE